MIAADRRSYHALTFCFSEQFYRTVGQPQTILL
jgi:hypothetical protein